MDSRKNAGGSDSLLNHLFGLFICSLRLVCSLGLVASLVCWVYLSSRFVDLEGVLRFDREIYSLWQVLVNHFPRIVGIPGAAALGWWAGSKLARQTTGSRRLTRVLAALSAAGLAWGLVPTWEGQSPISVLIGAGRVAAGLRATAAWGERTAVELVRRLDAIPAGDSVGYLRDRPTRAALRAAFPDLSERVHAAEEAWARRTTDAVAAEVEPVLKADPARASERLRTAYDELAGWEELTQAKDRLLDLRKRAVVDGLDVAKREALALIKQERYTAAAASADQSRRRWAAEAKTVGMRADLDYFAESYAFLADLARLANKSDPQ